MGKLTVGALRAVLVVVLAGTVFVQALMVRSVEQLQLATLEWVTGPP